MFVESRAGLSQMLSWPLVVALVASGIGEPPAYADTPKPLSLQAQQVPSVHGTPVVAKARPVNPTHGAQNPAPVRVTWPVAGSAQVDVGAGAPTRAGALPVYLTGTDGAASRVRVDLLDRSAVPAGWRDAVVLRLSGSAQSQAQLSVDYSGFAGAYGGDYASRLRLVELPDCALSTVEVAGCGAVPLPSTNDTATDRVSAAVTLAATGTTLVALTAGASGNSGTFAATSLSPSSNWAAGGNSGDFSWQYPVETPPALGDAQPDVTLSYSSSSVDGRNATTNNQPGWLGEGFHYAPGFIERAYKPCLDDKGSGANNTTDTGDLCWGTDNAVVSLSAASGELVKDASSGAWRLKNDDNTKIERRVDTVNADFDHEYWRLTTSDGTQYYFGLNRLPGYTGTAPANKTTNSVWTVPVAGNHANEPCHDTGFTASFCHQAWRWNLDYVVDTHGNTVSYFYGTESNNYARNLTDTDVASYIRGGWLDHIDYGTDRRSGTDTEQTSTAAPMRVLFNVDNRCLADCGTHDVTHWPDTPWDQSCTSTTSCKGLYSPTFWITKRLKTITTRVWNAGSSAYKDVDRWTLTHSFPPSGDDTRDGMWLGSIVHTGAATGAAVNGAAVNGAAVTLPSVNFDWTQMHNRVDTTTDGKPAMNWMRLSTIWTETGGKIDIRYLPQDCQSGSRMPSSPETNALRCYPVLELQPDKSIKREYFNKYPVQSVTESDQTGRGLDVTTTYAYVGSPGWRHTDDDGMTRDNLRTWSAYRGYRQVNTRVGIPDAGEQTLTETTYFQGMNGDLNGSGTRAVSLPALDLNGDGTTTGSADAPAVADEDAYAGMVRQSTVYNGVESAPVSTTVQQPWQSAATATRDMGDTTVFARHTGTAATWDADKLAAGGWRVTRADNTFDSYGLPAKVDDQGDVAVTGDETCTTTGYNRNITANLLELPAEEDEYALRCAQVTSPGPASDADVISMTRNLYDHKDFGVVPTEGELTGTDVAKTWTSGGGATWLTDSTTSYDDYGRVTDEVDVRGNHTTTSYLPVSGGPVTQMSETTPLGTAVTTLEPSWGAPTTVVDVNSKRTDVTYDALGRTSQVWLPNHLKVTYPNQPSSSYSYLVRNSGGVNAVTTNTLNASNVYTTTIALYDGLLRARQTQTLSMAAGHQGTVFSDTKYDSEGRAFQQSQHFDATVQPSTTLFSIADWQSATQTVIRYDRAGRVVANIFNTVGIEQWRSTTSYGGDRVNVVPPGGGTATTTVTDALDRTVAIRQYHNRADVGSDTRSLYDQVTYHYNRKGQRDSWTDNAGNTWTAGFDLLGRQIAAHDPDEGNSSATFNDKGDRLTATDNRGQTLAYTYDTLGRRTGEYATSTSGTKLATWTYDPAGASGYRASSSRFVGTDEYKVTVNGYTALYQPTSETYTIPDSQTGLSGGYTFGHSYKVDGSPATLSYPNAGGLGAETLTYTYGDTDGLPEMVQTNSPGRGQYVSNTDYTAYGEVSLVSLQTTGGTFLQRGLTYDDATHRLKQALTIRQTNPQAVDDASYGYDATGNVTKISNTGATGGLDTLCFAYDYARRLTEAWTPSSGDCNQTKSVAALGGPAPYWQSWTFDAAGDRKTQTDHAAAGNTVATSTYPASGANSVRPHAVSSVSAVGPAGTVTNAYSYDAIGDTTARPGTTAAQALTWDPEGRLNRVTEGANNTTYIYDADGNRLISSDPTTTTLYLPGEDIIRTRSTGAVNAIRFYSFAAQTGAMFSSATGKLTWLVSDQQGTQNTMADSGSQGITQRRQTPYGTARGTLPGWLNTRGFVGGTNDSTGLVHEGDREYDPSLGAFSSVDPLLDETNPQQLPGYIYSGGNPVTFSDPSGQMYAPDGGGGVKSSGCGSANACEHHIVLAHHQSEPKAKKKAPTCSANACEHRALLARGKSEPKAKRKSAPACSANACEHRALLARGKSEPRKFVTHPAPAAHAPAPQKDTRTWACKHLRMCTIGLCLNAGWAFVENYSGSACLQTDSHGLFATWTTAAYTKGNRSFGLQTGAGFSIERSDAYDKDSLADGAKYGQGNAGPISAGYAAATDKQGRHVHIVDIGAGVGSPAGGSGGTSTTDVSPYLIHKCDGFPFCNPFG